MMDMWTAESRPARGTGRVISFPRPSSRAIPPSRLTLSSLPPVACGPNSNRIKHHRLPTLIRSHTGYRLGMRLIPRECAEVEQQGADE